MFNLPNWLDFLSPARVGGLLLVVGAYFVSRGDIFKSVMVFFLADVCWVIIAFNSKDYIGVVSIAAGMSLGLLAYFKMNNGTMRKTLKV